jgi:hypothetical protein
MTPFSKGELLNFPSSQGIEQKANQLRRWKMRILNLIGGLLLLLFDFANIVSWVMHGHVPNFKEILLFVAMMLFAFSRLVAFGMPRSPAIRPIRFGGLAVIIGYMLMPR